MRRYFDVYIRQAGAPLTAFAITSNMLTGDAAGWDRLELLADKPKLTLENETEPMGTGIDYTISEKLSVECGTMLVSKTEYDYLRSTFHNRLCDFLFYDPSDDSFLAAAFGIIPAVTLLLESGTNCTIKIGGSRVTSSEVTSKLLLASNSYSCLISGKVTLLDGVTPVEGAVVTITLTSPAQAFTDTTDKDGNYNIMAGVPQSASTTATFTSVVKAAKSFTLPSALTVSRNNEYVQNVKATA